MDIIWHTMQGSPATSCLGDRYARRAFPPRAPPLRPHLKNLSVKSGSGREAGGEPLWPLAPGFL